MSDSPEDPKVGHFKDPASEEEVDPGWPWSFLLIVGAGALYLILRLVEAVNDFLLN